MSASQMPENMGKKIVEALKRQALYEDSFSTGVNENNTESNLDLNFSIPDQSFTEIKEIEDNVQPQVQTQAQPQIQPQLNQQISEPSIQFSIPSTPVQNIAYNSYSSELPTNVAVLKKLISQLPAGVSKQVGAQIIRQTIEALGISMNSVLQEAQQVQESLNSSVTECTIKMQEYKNQIMQLEANTRDYQRQMAQINDLISLFILTDNKK